VTFSAVGVAITEFHKLQYETQGNSVFGSNSKRQLLQYSLKFSS